MLTRLMCIAVGAVIGLATAGAALAEEGRVAHDKLDAVRMEAATEKLFDDLPVYRASPQLQAYIERHQPMSWGGSCSGNLSEFNTPELAARRAAEIRNGGYTSVFINGRQNRLNHLDMLDEMLKFESLVAEASHAQGLKVIDHVDFTIAWQSAYPHVFAKARGIDWFMKDLRTGTVNRWLCLNNPSYREFYAEYLEKLVRAGIDGFQLDEVGFHDQKRTYCGCEHCRAKFEEETGFRFPEHWDEDVIDNLANPFWRLWKEWQKKCIVEFEGFLLERLRKINPDVLILAYSTAIYRSSVRVHDMQDHARISFVGTEGTDMVYAGAYNFFAQYRILSSFARQYGRPAWIHGATNNNEEEDFAAFLSALSANGTSWMKAKVFGWTHWPEARAWADPVADVGILLVSPTRDGEMLTADLHSAETHGWCEALGVSGVQFEPVPCLSVKPSELKKYRVLVLPYAVNMPRRLGELVGKYVEEGGVVVVTGVAGRYDRLGSPLGEEAFFRSMGIREITAADKMTYIDPAYYSKELSTGGVDRTLILTPGRFPNLPGRIKLLNSYRFNISLAPGVRCDVLAKFEDGAPAILSLPSGKGRYIYLAFLPGHMIHQPRLQKSYKWGRYLQPEAVALMRALLRDATDNADRVVVDGTGILSAAYQKGNRLWVRLLNVSGIKLPEGEKIDVVTPQYPDLGPIRIRVRMPVSPDAQLVDPDRGDVLNLKVVREGQEHIVIVPARSFRRFAFVRMEVTQ